MGLLLIRGAKQLLTLRGSPPRRGQALRDLGIIPDGAVLIRDGLIDEVGPTRRVENLAKARRAEKIDATGRVVMPGFVDCHTHLVFATPWLRDYEAGISGAPPGPASGLTDSARKIRSVTVRRLQALTRPLLLGMARHGTTTVEAKSGYGLDPALDLKILRALAKLDGQPLDIQPTFLAWNRGDPAEAAGSIYRLCAEWLPLVAGRRLARFADIVWGEQGFSREHVRRFLDVARILGLLLKVHGGPFGGPGAGVLAAEAGAISVDHLEDAGPADIQSLARSHTMATLLPASQLCAATGRYPPARAMIEAGVGVSLGSNFNPEDSRGYNMQTVISLACERLRMLPSEALSAATINAAYAVRSSYKVGSVELGKQADLLVLNVSDYREIAYYSGVNCVHLTIKRGEIVFSAGVPPAV